MYGGIIDLLGVDEDARIHVLELKRDRSPRDFVAQTLDYGSSAQNLTLDDTGELFAKAHDDEDFEESFVDRFGQPLPDVCNPDQLLTIVASELDDNPDRIRPVPRRTVRRTGQRRVLPALRRRRPPLPRSHLVPHA